jgi:hypothetical protein
LPGSKVVGIRVHSVSGTQALDNSPSPVGSCWSSLVDQAERQGEGFAEAKQKGHYKGCVPTARWQAVEMSD